MNSIMIECMGLLSMKNMGNFSGLGQGHNMTDMNHFYPNDMEDVGKVTIRNVSRTNPPGFTDNYGLGEYLELVTTKPGNDSIMDTMATMERGPMRLVDLDYQKCY